MKRRPTTATAAASALDTTQEYYNDGKRKPTSILRRRMSVHGVLFIVASTAAALVSSLVCINKTVDHMPSTSQSQKNVYAARCVPSLPTNRIRARPIAPVPKQSKMTYYSSSIVFKSSLNNIGKLLEVQPGYRRVEVAKNASMVWTKKMAEDSDTFLKLALGKGALTYSDLQPWQRINHLRHERTMDDKDSFDARIRAHECPPGTRAWFLPETYRLHISTEKEHFLRRLAGGGMEEAWVWKDPSLDRGEGIAILGASSDRLKELQLKLQNADVDVALPLSWSNSTNAQKRMIVQKYMMPTVLWDGHKFDLRVYWLVASVDPLLVYYHDGIVRVSLTKYDADDFSSKSHLTNVVQSLSTTGGQDKDLATRSFEDFDELLRRYIKTEALPKLAAHCKEEPLSYIRTQIKDALAFVVDAFREDVFNPENLPADNSYALFGADFLIDHNLNVWITEVQYGPSETAEAKAKRDILDLMIPQMFNMVEEIRAKQDAKTDILPMESAKTWELLYG